MNESLKRNKYTVYLLALLILLPWFTYCFALADYFRLQKEVRLQNSEIAVLRQKAPASASEEQAADMLFSGKMIDQLNSAVAQRDLRILHYMPRISQREKNEALCTAEATLSGDFLQLTALIEQIETKFTSCRIVSVSFFTAETGHKANQELQCTIVIQQIVKTS